VHVVGVGKLGLTASADLDRVDVVPEIVSFVPRVDDLLAIGLLGRLGGVHTVFGYSDFIPCRRVHRVDGVEVARIGYPAVFARKGRPRLLRDR
jgi:hypothetical protein